MGEDQQWFDNVENFCPLRGGRRGETLNKVISSTSKISVDEAEKKFQKELSEAAQQEDPLASMCNYVSWFEEHFPSGKRKFFYPILYKICVTYCSMDIYKNDERLLKIWLKLTENFPESSLAVMEFAFTKGSCRNLAKFYICWSHMYQSIEWWNKAREKLQLALKMNAVPLDLIHKASDELESNIMEMCKQIPEHTFDNEEFENSVESARVTFSRLRGIGRMHFAPIIRLPQEPPGVLSISKKSKTDRFEIFTDDRKSSDQYSSAFKTPLAPSKYFVKRSKISESLINDLDFQALFGMPQEHVDLQITNEENQPQTPYLNSSKLPNFDLKTPIENSFCIYEDINSQQKIEGRTKSKLKLRKELIKEISIEEYFANKIIGKDN
ncbi:BUB1 N-terminal domain-containing protein [Meloidogyne graminicola]|uniref:BUB1 N-terminal domain-containing protein n=1 Tax=Meloidogyne graminicola TaxID=189291 RepID=A0A8S9ZEX4_9BILA|nr:BUB1 N-terminal domain-containing protein [Meloidogyne graminicola]